MAYVMAIIPSLLIVLILQTVSSNPAEMIRICADEECKVPISKATTLSNYPTGSSLMPSFRRGVTVTVFSKAADSSGTLWGIEVKGKRGFARKNFLQESKVVMKKPQYNVTIEKEIASFGGKMDNELLSSTVTTDSSVPVKSTESYNLKKTVIDGTSIDFNTDDIYINPTEATAHISHIQTTSVPDVPGSKYTEEIVSEGTLSPELISGALRSEFGNKNPVRAGVKSEEEDGNEEEDDEEEKEDDEDGGGEEEDGQEEELPESSENTNKLETVKMGSECVVSGEEQPDAKGLYAWTNTLVGSGGEQAPESGSGSGGGHDGDGDVVSSDDNDQISVPGYEVGSTPGQPTTESPSQIAADPTAEIPQVTESSVSDETSSEINIQTSTENSVYRGDTTKGEEVQPAQVGSDQEMETVVEIGEHEKEVIQKHEADGESKDLNINERAEGDQMAPVMRTQTDVSNLSENEHDVKANIEKNEFLSSEAKESESGETSEDTTRSLYSGNGRNTLEPSSIPRSETGDSRLSIETGTEDSHAAEDLQDSDSQISQPEVQMSEDVPSEPEVLDFQYSKSLNPEEKESQDIEENSQKMTDELLDSSNTESEGTMGLISSTFSNIKNFFFNVFHSESSKSVSENNAQEENSDAVVKERQNADTDADSVSQESQIVCGDVAGCQAEAPCSHQWSEDWQSQAQFDKATMDTHKTSYDTFIYLVVTAVTVLFFALGHYYIEKRRCGGSLIAKISCLEKALMVLSQEKFVLKDELKAAKEKLITFEDSSLESESSVFVSKMELEGSKAARSELEEQVASLEKELEAATEAGLELNRMMSELLSSQHDSDSLMKSVEHLQKQLDCQKDTINTMNESLNAKNIENENLKSELASCSSNLHNLEEELKKANKNITELEVEKVKIEHDFQQKNKSIEEKLLDALESKSADSERLDKELSALQDVLGETRRTLAAREGEVKVLQEWVGQLESQSKEDDRNVSMESLLDVGRQRAELELICQERDELKEKFLGEENARKLLEDHVRIVSEEVSTLRSKYQDAEHDKTEAQTRLEVLSNYFKEKETQLQKKLGLQEAISIRREDDVLSSFEQIKSFEEEIQNYKSQNELLKKEILDQERSMKTQIVALENMVHENWVAARQAERALEVSKQEASQLRNRLTLVERNASRTVPGTNGQKSAERSKHNGEVMASPACLSDTQELASSPLHYGLPATPPLISPAGQTLPPAPFPGMPLGMFLPPNVGPGVPFSILPPPGGLFPDDLRPPPLGRMSSPPPDSQGTFSPFENSPPLSSPNHPYRLPYKGSPTQFHQTPPTSSPRSFGAPYAGKWDDGAGSPRSSFRPVPRDSPREAKGTTMSPGHSPESLDKASRYNSRV